MQLFQIYCKTFARSCNRMHYHPHTFAGSCKIWLNLVKFLPLWQHFCKSFIQFGRILCTKIFVIVTKESDTFLNFVFSVLTNLVHKTFVIVTKELDTFLNFVFSSTNCSQNLTVESDTSVSHRFRKWQEWSYSEGRDKVTLKNIVSFSISIQTN